MGTSARFGSRSVDTPGPGQYNPPSPQKAKVNKHGSSPAFGFGTSPRDNARPSTAPGPGQYNMAEVGKPASRQSVFGSAQRGFERGRRPTSPGPGTYNAGTTVGAEGPKLTFAPKRDGGRKLETPGPGAYHVASEPVLPRARASPRGWGFGTATRDSRSLRTTPGPGAYNAEVPVTGSGPKYTMRARRESRRSPSPQLLPQKAA